MPDVLSENFPTLFFDFFLSNFWPCQKNFKSKTASLWSCMLSLLPTSIRWVLDNRDNRLVSSGMFAYWILEICTQIACIYGAFSKHTQQVYRNVLWGFYFTFALLGWCIYAVSMENICLFYHLIHFLVVFHVSVWHICLCLWYRKLKVIWKVGQEVALHLHLFQI